jgi:hypothetical protein
MATATEVRLITFRAGPETFVLDIMAVRQIIRTPARRRLTAPSFVEGIIVLRNGDPDHRSARAPLSALGARRQPTRAHHAPVRASSA